MLGINTLTCSMKESSTAKMLPETGSLYAVSSTPSLEIGSWTTSVLRRVAIVTFIAILFPRVGKSESQRFARKYGNDDLWPLGSVAEGVLTDGQAITGGS